MENHLDFIHYTNIKSKASRVCWNQQIEHHQQTLKTAHANTHGAKNTISISLNFSTKSFSLNFLFSFLFFFYHSSSALQLWRCGQICHRKQ